MCITYVYTNELVNRVMELLQGCTFKEFQGGVRCGPLGDRLFNIAK